MLRGISRHRFLMQCYNKVRFHHQFINGCHQTQFKSLINLYCQYARSWISYNLLQVLSYTLKSKR